MEDTNRGKNQNEGTNLSEIEPHPPISPLQEHRDHSPQESQNPSLSTTATGRSPYANNISAPIISAPGSQIPNNTFCDNSGNIPNLGGMEVTNPESMSFVGGGSRTQGNSGALGWHFLSPSPHIQSATAPTFLSTPKDAGAPYMSPATSPTDWNNPHQYMPISNLHAIAAAGFFSPTGQAVAPIPMNDNAALWTDFSNVVPGTPSMAAVPSRSPFITSEADPTLCNVPYSPNNGCSGDDFSPTKSPLVAEASPSLIQQHRPLESGNLDFTIGGHSRQADLRTKEVDGMNKENTIPNYGNVPNMYTGNLGGSDLNISYLVNQSPQYNVQHFDNKPLSYPNTVGMQLSQGVDWGTTYKPITPSQGAFLPPSNNQTIGTSHMAGGRQQLGGNNTSVSTPTPLNCISQERLEAAKAFQSLEDDRVWMEWENGKLDGRLIDTVLHAKSLIEQMLNEFSVERASEVLRAASTLLGRTHQTESMVMTAGGALPSVKLVHPDEFKNPSTFLQIYGDPLCFTKNGSLPKKGRNGNWECSKCSNVNFPRRFRCNMCSTTRDEEGDWVVCEYARQVYERYLSIYKNQQKPGQQQSPADIQISTGLHQAPPKENASTISGHQDILIPTSGAMGPGGGLFNFPVIGPPAQRPAVGVSQQQQLQPQTSHKQNRGSNSNNPKQNSQRQVGVNNTGSAYQNTNTNNNSGSGNVTPNGSSRQNAGQNRRGHQDDENHARTQHPHTYAEVVSGDRGNATPVNGMANQKGAGQSASQSYSTNYSASRQGSTARNSKAGAAAINTSHQKQQQQPVA